MTKKKIMDVVNQDGASISINGISTLRRDIHEDYFEKGKTIDRLTLEFSDAVKEHIEITSREYAGIMAEIEQATRDHMQRVTDKLINDIRAGYIH